MQVRQVLQLEQVTQFVIFTLQRTHDVGVSRQYEVLLHELQIETFPTHPPQFGILIAQHVLPVLT